MDVLSDGLKKNQRSSWEILQARRRVWSFCQIVIRKQFNYVLIVRLCPFLSIQTFCEVVLHEEMVVGCQSIRDGSILPRISIDTPEDDVPIYLYVSRVIPGGRKYCLREFEKIDLLFISEFGYYFSSEVAFT